MMDHGLLQTLLLLGVLTALAVPLGGHLARVLEGRRHILTPLFGGLERLCYRLAGVDAAQEMSWKQYTLAMLAFSMVGVLAVFALQRLQGVLPLNPQQLPAVQARSAFCTAVSFVSNTNWQDYAGETSMSTLTQMLALAVQNFLSSATGIGILAALVRGLARHSSDTVGNFWADLVRSTLYLLLPASLLLALALVAQGVPQSFAPPVRVAGLEPIAASRAAGAATQTLILGPVASQVAIKQLGTNGGGYYNANSAHPFENPTPLSNFLELTAILLIPAAQCVAFGHMVGDRRQGRAILVAMTALLVLFLAAAVWAEQAVPPAWRTLGVQAAVTNGHAGGNMEGKETRFGVVGSAIWATFTTAASNGSVNAMHDSFMPLAGLVPMALMQVGEVVFGGVGSGLYGMLVFVILTVFMAGLMVGRTPEYLGKKIEAFEMKMASLVVLIPPVLVLLGTALAVSVPPGTATLGNPGMHGFSEILYALSSAANNNGSAFAGLGAATPFYDLLLGFAMFAGRFGLAVPVLALAGSLARKKRIPAGEGTLPTHTPLFVVMLMGVVLVVGALTFLPALALGPVVEHLALFDSAARSH